MSNSCVKKRLIPKIRTPSPRTTTMIKQSNRSISTNSLNVISPMKSRMISPVIPKDVRSVPPKSVSNIKQRSKSPSASVRSCPMYSKQSPFTKSTSKIPTPQNRRLLESKRNLMGSASTGKRKPKPNPASIYGSTNRLTKKRLF